MRDAKSSVFVLGIVSDITPERCTLDETGMALDEARGVALAVRWVPAFAVVGARLWRRETFVVTEEEWAHGIAVLCGVRLACAAECRATCAGETADEPLSGDWDFFAAEFGEATAAERRAFERGYCEEEE